MLESDGNAVGVHQRDGSSCRRTGHDAVGAYWSAVSVEQRAVGVGSRQQRAINPRGVFKSMDNSGAAAGFGGMSNWRTLIVTVAMLLSRLVLSVSR